MARCHVPARSVLTGTVVLAVLLQCAETRATWQLKTNRQHKIALPRPDCDLCAENWLFILAPGRGTASTTALSMFNSVPGFEISGEHNGVLHAEAGIFRLLMETLKAEGTAWEGNGIDSRALLCNVQHLIKGITFGTEYSALSRNTTVLGFKEVRYDSLEVLRFIAGAFPCARYVLTTWFADGAAETAAAPKLFHKVASQFPSTATLLPRDTVSLNKYNTVLRELGVKGCTFNKVLHENVGGANSHDPDFYSGILEGSCDLSEVDFRLSSQQLETNKRLWSELSKELNTPDFEIL
mmetsp:Transcript_32107/g.91038  ORF Transcript_32107/g.91038 Transcript_32107/m.91038 type:complete len:295 (-) Transcript_32107:395-1279(-)|eukprot:CAMPEP_0117652034 /NCGR_PEP_ID=MMETSP0804-20121206/2413_1 /TAXON_ID=1074897 /ORGANISM="Tetraselmis astigmatica, Strain CCMP880" /LENGTH=294 /DNA_ID=CAMNT_0005458057 /DNA_START=188 /DNA_END=1072 /DNA_ORIENTATION=+